jgi:glycosyltransferase involved in cell wall biosynthesis
VRVLHWYASFLTGGGVANSVLALATAQQRAGAAVSIASTSWSDPEYGALPTDELRIAEWNGIARVRHDRLSFHLLSLKDARALRSLEPDVVHVHGEFIPDNWWVPRLWPCPVVLTPHGAFHQAVMRRRAKGKRVYTAVANQLLYRNVSAFHALSPSEQADIQSSLPSSRVYCVPQGPSPSIDLRSAGSQDKRPPEAPIVFLFVGRLDVQAKGLDILLEAFALVAEHQLVSRPIVLSLAGPDCNQGRSYLSDLARRLGIERMIRFRGPVRTSEVPILFQSCDVYVQLSRNEGAPLSLNDALVLGKPAIVSRDVGTASFDELSALNHMIVVQTNASAAAEAIVHTVVNLEALKIDAERARPELSGFLNWDRAAGLHLQMYSKLPVMFPASARAK